MSSCCEQQIQSLNQENESHIQAHIGIVSYLHSIQYLPQKACSGETWTLLLNDVNAIMSFGGYNNSENYSC